MSLRKAGTVLEATLDAPRLSRRVLREVLEVWEADDLAEVAELLTSELVSNVVMHALTEVDMEVSWDEEVLRVEVRDGSDADVTLDHDARDEGGRGLWIIAGLAREWG